MKRHKELEPSVFSLISEEFINTKVWEITYFFPIKIFDFFTYHMTEKYRGMDYEQ